MIKPFAFASTPQLHFGAGKISTLPSIVKTYGINVLLVTGAKSFATAAYGKELLDQLQARGIALEISKIEKEPTPQMIDSVVGLHANKQIQVVVGIGGGSVLDAGKAISAMLPFNDNVKNYLEGVGTKQHSGKKIPFIAVPTTSGTGSEATKNAVLSEIGEQGFKKSLRHNNFVPDVALIDPALTVTCSKETTAASGMDSFTQLLESYVSISSNAITDALALEGLKRVSSSLQKAYHNGADINVRSDMSMAAYLSGITLANAGLGLVHGFASSVGGYFDISHGVICSSIMAAANKVTVSKLRNEKSNNGALKKYSLAGKLFSTIENKSDDYYIDHLLELIPAWAEEMNIPHLLEAGLDQSYIKKIVAQTDNKNNPVSLDRNEMEEVLRMSL